ncbi:Pfs, NACHT and ankyrin domain protein [Fusarium avenaceum]|nr:Pfs, NACHT and ankyrin domain protein [Fusarium avenaceum]
MLYFKQVERFINLFNSWICALHIETSAALAMLDEIHGELPRRPNDSNTYTLGNIKDHNIVIACLPQGQYGNNNATNVLTNLTRTFPSIRHGLMVGIGGGVPGKLDVRLGDIVVGSRVMQYDFGKVMAGGRIQTTAVPRVPSHFFLTAITTLRARHELNSSRISGILCEKMEGYPTYDRPETADDLFEPSYMHDLSQKTCRECDRSQLTQREPRQSSQPVIHYGGIASSNQVMRDAMTRDRLARELDIICFEMEAAGLMDVLPCLPIRGICDYSDSHKAKEWQRYAAAVAAAYARELLETLPAVSDTRQELNLQPCSCKPGAGKSIIMKFIYMKTKKTDIMKQALTISFFFNARGGLLEKSLSGMYQSLLLQLFEGFPDLQHVLDDPDLVPRNQVSCPPLAILKDLFRSAVESLESRELRCFVDALDKYNEQQVQDMVIFFEEVAEHCLENNVRFRTGIRLTLEGQDGHDEDLKHYILKNLRIQDAVLVDELKQIMLEKAAGVFLWVALVVDILNKENRRGRLALRRRLQEVPNELSELFRDLLTRDQEHIEDLLLSLLWILLSTRPLTPGEYYHALWCGLLLEDLADTEMPAINSSDAKDCFNKCIISSSKGLAETTKGSKPTVQFIHESVRDFLIKDKDWEIQGHERLKSCCSAYISRKAIGNAIDNPQIPESLGMENSLVKEFPFLEYACKSILVHADTAAYKIPQQQFLSEFPVSDWVRVFNAFEKHKIRMYDEEADILYILADRGHPELIRTRLKTHPDIAKGGGRYGHPVLAAMAKGNKESVVALLSLSSSVRHDFDVTTDLTCKINSVELGNTPFYWAARNGHPDICAALLLQSPQDRVAEVGELLRWRDRKFVELVLERVEHIASEPRDVSIFLQIASARDYLEVMRLLLDMGEDVSAVAKNFLDTPSWNEVSENDHILTVKMLLDKGADIKVTDRRRGYAETVKLLLDRGSDVMATNIDEETCLHFASRGSDVMARQCWGLTCLHLASKNGHTETVKLLLSRGSDVMARTSQRGQIETVKLLLSRGSDVVARDDEGRTALHLASERGHTEAAKLLLSRGSDVMARAAENGHTETVKLLLSRGSDVMARDDEGRTALESALLYHSDEVSGTGSVAASISLSSKTSGLVK